MCLVGEYLKTKKASAIFVFGGTVYFNIWIIKNRDFNTINVMQYEEYEYVGTHKLGAIIYNASIAINVLSTPCS